MSKTLSDIEKRFQELEHRFLELKNLNQILAQQAQEYFLLFDTVRQLNPTNGLKSFYKSLDKVLVKNFGVDEYALILKNPNSDLLSIHHSMGLSKIKLKEIFYRPGEGLVGRVYSKNKAIYISDTRVLKGISYYFDSKNIKGSLFYLPISTSDEECIGVLKMRKISTNGFSELHRSIFTNLQREIGIAIEKAQKIDHLLSKVYVDEQTLLKNKKFFNEQFQIEFKRSQRYQHDLSIICLSINNLNQISKLLSQQGSNKLLEKISKILTENIRSFDLCSRYSKNEFFILLPETSKQAAYEAAVKLKNLILETIPSLLPGTTDAQIIVSMSIANFPKDTIEPDVLLKYAKEALKYSKKNGENEISSVESIQFSK